MAPLADLYKVLGVPEDADAAAIKKAFRQKAKELHPDKHPGDKKAEDGFKELNQAYEILSDAEKRRRYDSMRRSPFQGQAQGPNPFGGAGQGGFAGGSISDLFEMFFGGGGPSPFGRPSAFDGFGGAAAQAGRDLETEVAVSFEDAALGRPVTFSLEGQDPLRLNLPPGAESGLRLRLAGQGGLGRGGARGDLYLTLKVRPSDRFKREGLDIVSTLRLNLGQALLGASVEAATLHGQLRLKVPAGSAPGTRLRLRGKGIQSAQGQGDHLVELALALPDDLDEAERQAIRAMAAKRGWEL
jgi:molecular chaperone DnaJ